MKPFRLTCPPSLSRDVFDQLRVPDHRMPSENGFVADLNAHDFGTLSFEILGRVYKDVDSRSPASYASDRAQNAGGVRSVQHCQRAGTPHGRTATGRLSRKRLVEEPDQHCDHRSMAIRSGTPARIKLRATVRLQSCSSRCGTLAFRQTSRIHADVIIVDHRRP